MSRRPNILEIALVIFCVLLIIGVFYWGFDTQNLVNKDKQKSYDITQVVLPALLEFYQNSAAVENQRFYPIAQCSGDLNEVDYELSLRQHLSGQKLEIETHEYIPNNLFPRDKSGVYSQTLAERKVPHRCPNLLNNIGLDSAANSQLSIYGDFPSCNFRSSTLVRDSQGRSRRVPRYLNCYLYTSSNSGDSFRLAYYSEVRKCFVVYQRFRNQDLQTNLECRF